MPDAHIIGGMQEGRAEFEPLAWHLRPWVIIAVALIVALCAGGVSACIKIESPSTTTPTTTAPKITTGRVNLPSPVGPNEKECPDGSQVPVGQDCPPLHGPDFIDCPDGSQVEAGQDCPEECPDGTVHRGQNCIPICPDGTLNPYGEECPTPRGDYYYCPDGSQVPVDETCPTPGPDDGTDFKDCPDGSQVPVSQDCPAGLRWSRPVFGGIGQA